MLSSEAEHPNCMYEWMNHIISPEANAAWPSGSVRRRPTRSRATSPATRPCLLAGQHCDIYHADDEEFFDQIEFWKTPVSDCGDGEDEDCKTYDEWVQGWNEVKG